MKSPFLSIIIPYYNIELWMLDRCIQSIFSQAIPEEDFEIIVIDDGSQTSPQEWLEALGKNNIVYFYQSNQGLSGARNQGIRIAKGEYIHFLDSDDYLYDQTLSICLNQLKVSSVDLLHFNFKTCYIKERDAVKQPVIHFSDKMSGADFMYKHNIFGAACFYIFKKEICLKHDLYFTLSTYHEDEEFTAKMYFFCQSVIVTNLIVYAYYQREDSIINTQEENHLYQRITHFKQVILRLREFQKNHKNSVTETQHKALERRINFLVCDYIIGVVRSFSSYSVLRRELIQLKEEGLYPLTGENYSFKYLIFKRMSSYRIGLRMICFFGRIRCNHK